MQLELRGETREFPGLRVVEDVGAVLIPIRLEMNLSIGRKAGFAMLRGRMTNDPTTELQFAADQQRTITRLRLERLLG